MSMAPMPGRFDPRDFMESKTKSAIEFAVCQCLEREWSPLVDESSMDVEVLEREKSIN